MVKTCGTCHLTDSLCYTSNPPQVKCTITGKLHYYNDECDCAVDKNTENVEATVKCKYFLPCGRCDVRGAKCDVYKE